MNIKLFSLSLCTAFFIYNPSFPIVSCRVLTNDSDCKILILGDVHDNQVEDINQEQARFICKNFCLNPKLKTYMADAVCLLELEDEYVSNYNKTGTFGVTVSNTFKNFAMIANNPQRNINIIACEQRHTDSTLIAGLFHNVGDFVMAHNYNITEDSRTELNTICNSYKKYKSSTLKSYFNRLDNYAQQLAYCLGDNSTELTEFDGMKQKLRAYFSEINPDREILSVLIDKTKSFSNDNFVSAYSNLELLISEPDFLWAELNFFKAGLAQMLWGKKKIVYILGEVHAESLTKLFVKYFGYKVTHKCSIYEKVNESQFIVKLAELDSFEHMLTEFSKTFFIRSQPIKIDIAAELNKIDKTQAMLEVREILKKHDNATHKSASSPVSKQDHKTAKK